MCFFSHCIIQFKFICMVFFTIHCFKAACINVTIRKYSQSEMSDVHVAVIYNLWLVNIIQLNRNIKHLYYYHPSQHANALLLWTNLKGNTSMFCYDSLRFQLTRLCTLYIRLLYERLSFHIICSILLPAPAEWVHA